ncbi:hypothetical protein C8J57DRAFT_1237444 [Mycena rebaudengoi]|nr:hypothetical protein C8J57DRAFT_1254066 [Mycena rebaudengoi]KAJ7253650.1 hypothetical protein C8J57DRAFT_1237444 [Mycena rebaudengoi]
MDPKTRDAAWDDVKNGEFVVLVTRVDKATGSDLSSPGLVENNLAVECLLCEITMVFGVKLIIPAYPKASTVPTLRIIRLLELHTLSPAYIRGICFAFEVWELVLKLSYSNIQLSGCIGTPQLLVDFFLLNEILGNLQ